MNRFLLSAFMMLFFLASTGILQAQDTVGGPYTVHEHTVMLLNFEDTNLNILRTL